MNLESFEKIKYLLNLHNHEDETVIDVVLSNYFHVKLNFIDPFIKEFNINLLNMETTSGKVDVIKHHLFELLEIQFIFSKYPEIFMNDTLIEIKANEYEYIDSKANIIKLDRFGNYYVKVHEFYNEVLDIIQIDCLKYGINFFKICFELNFSLEYNDSGITLGFHEDSNYDLNIHENKKITASIVGLFFQLLLACNIETRDLNESEANFCIRMCEKYKIMYRDRIRQNIKSNDTKANREKLRKYLLPLIEKSLASKVEEYLMNENNKK